MGKDDDWSWWALLSILATIGLIIALWDKF